MRHGPPLVAPCESGPNRVGELVGAVPSRTGVGKSVTGPVGSTGAGTPEPPSFTLEERAGTAPSPSASGGEEDEEPPSVGVWAGAGAIDPLAAAHAASASAKASFPPFKSPSRTTIRCLLLLA